tara:strand:+ start:1412 stop:1558 length:147 start_codon:yes stop_codon:yes gene_type:complete
MNYFDLEHGSFSRHSAQILQQQEKLAPTKSWPRKKVCKNIRGSLVSLK